MDSDGLATFLAVHETRGFSAAAARLGRTQPAISRRIALLEAELGAPLFERTAGWVRLSLAGRVLLPYAERALAAVKDAEAAVRALKTPGAGPVSLAMVGTLAGSGLTQVLKAFAQTRPGVELSLVTATSSEVSDKVRRGEAAIGLRYRTDRSGDLRCIPLAAERMVIVCSPEHRLAGGRAETLEDLAGETWLAFADAQGPDEPASQSILAQFAARGVGAVAWRAVDSLTAQKRLAEAGFGLVLLAQSAVAEELARGSLAVITVGDLAAVNPVSAVVRREGYLNAAAQGLLEVLEAQMGWDQGLTPSARPRESGDP
jgi:DNA-binding transcriptional LysR family regulator